MTVPREANSWLTVERNTSASRQRVWDMMADRWTYSQWVVGNSPLRELVLLANGRPFGKARVTLRLFDTDVGGCRIEMSEVPASAPLSWLPDSVGLASAFPRNRECTWRLAALAERRQAEHQ
jgi:uncharacterized protein YndB with AHSA1/START domain